MIWASWFDVAWIGLMLHKLVMMLNAFGVLGLMFNELVLIVLIFHYLNGVLLAWCSIIRS